MQLTYYKMLVKRKFVWSCRKIERNDIESFMVKWSETVDYVEMAMILRVSDQMFR